MMQPARVSVVIEPYIAKPEVDANLVLLDGQVVYSDIENGFPARGDAADVGLDDNFQETQLLLPSELSFFVNHFVEAIAAKGLLPASFIVRPFLSLHHAPHGVGWDSPHAKE